jgi:TorA maturation chaperone TorD
MTMADLGKTATADAARLAFALLARCLQAPLPAEQLAALAGATSSTVPAGRRMGNEIVTALAGIDDWSALALRLSREHVTMFRGLREGHGPPPPFESLWREGVCMGESTRRVITAYREAGFPISADGRACDDLATELLFVASLCTAEAEGHGDAAAVALRQSQQRAFLDRHLLRWAPEYCQAAAQAAEHPFYRAVLEAVPRLLEDAAARLADAFVSVGALGEGWPVRVAPHPSETHA